LLLAIHIIISTSLLRARWDGELRYKFGGMVVALLLILLSTTTIGFHTSTKTTRKPRFTSTSEEGSIATMVLPNNMII